MLGGHKVQSLTCGYCGSVLDANDEFKVVKTFKDLKRPYCPVKIGMRGRIHGVDFIAIGVLQYRDNDLSTWVEVCLYSPTHGYAWLEYGHGHFVFSRRTRDLPEYDGVLHHKSPFVANGYLFKTHSIYDATVTFVEGELTYLAQVGDRARVIEGISPPIGFSIESKGNEQEFQLSEYLVPADAYSAFGLDADEARARAQVHPLQPYEPTSLTSGLRLSGLLFTPVALALVLYTLMLGSGTALINQTFSAKEIYGKAGAVTHQFEITDAQRLISLDLYSSMNNAWGFFEVVVKKSGEEIFSMGKQISYYSGYSGGESWSEGSTDAHAYFKVPQAGTYTLEISGEGGTGSTGRRPQARAISVQVREGVKVSRYYLALLVLSALAWGAGWYSKRRFEAARWDEDDDDDD